MRLTSLLSLAALLLAAAPLRADDTKAIGLRYRIKVSSAGIPTLGGVTSGYKLRTRYQVSQGEALLGEAYLGDPVYVAEPGRYRITVNGRSAELDFGIPPEMTRDRIAASWQRQRAVELRPVELGRRLTIPSLWVLHPPQVTGEHNDALTLHLVSEDGEVGPALAGGLAVVYPPEEIKDIDDGVLFANTLVHLLPGSYELRINGSRLRFELADGEMKLLRLGALRVTGPVPAGAGLAQLLDGDRRREPVEAPADGAWFVVAPGRFAIGGQGVVVGEAVAAELSYDPARMPGLKRPRLGIRAITDPDSGGVRINGFLPGSPVAAAGLKVGDRIIAIDGQEVRSTSELAEALVVRRAGNTAELTLVRPGRDQPIKVNVSLGLEGAADAPEPAPTPEAEPAPEPAPRRHPF